MPLTMVHYGQTKRVERIHGKSETRRFLKSLGFIPGSQILVVNEINGNLIVNIKESRVALSKSMANKIFVL